MRSPSARTLSFAVIDQTDHFTLSSMRTRRGGGRDHASSAAIAAALGGRSPVTCARWPLPFRWGCRASASAIDDTGRPAWHFRHRPLTVVEVGRLVEHDTPSALRRHQRAARSRIALRLSRSLRLARRIAGAIIGAISLENPAGSPRLRSLMRVPPLGVGVQA